VREEVNALTNAVGGSLHAPTDASMLRIRELTEQTGALQRWLEALVATDIARINEMINRARVGKPIS
jgi:hypothetical protein